MNDSSQLPEENEIENNTPADEQTDEQSVKPKSKPKLSPKKLAIIIVGLLVLGSLTAFAMTKQDKKAEPVADQQQETPAQPEIATNLRAAFADVDGSVYTVNDDGSVKLLEKREKSFQNSTLPVSSPQGTYLSKATKDGLFVRKATSQEDYTKIFAISEEEADSLSYIWYPDESGLLVVTTKDKSPNKGQDYYIPENYETVYSLNVDGKSKKKLFDHTETYGGAYLEAVNVTTGRFYWTMSGEGGPRSFNVNDLATGKLLKSHTSFSVLETDKTLGDQDFYSINNATDATTRSLLRINLLTGNSTKIHGLSGLSDKTLQGTTDCSEGQIYSGTPRFHNGLIYFAVADNKANTTKLFSIKPDGSGLVEVYSEDGLRELNITTAVGGKFIVRRGADALCSASTKYTNGDPEYFIFDLATKKFTQIQMPKGAAESYPVFSPVKLEV